MEAYTCTYVAIVTCRWHCSCYSTCNSASFLHVSLVTKKYRCQLLSWIYFSLQSMLTLLMNIAAQGRCTMSYVPT